MKDILNKLKNVLRLIGALIPTRLPMGIAEFHAWADSLIAIGNFPTDDEDSIKFALSTMVMHLGPSTAYKPKMYFITAIKAGAAKQVAAGVFQQIKAKQKAAEATAKLQQESLSAEHPIRQQ